MSLFNTTFNKKSRTWHGPGPVEPIYNPNISIGAVLLNSLQLNPNHIGQITEYNDLKLRNSEIRLRTIRTILKLEEIGIKMNDVVGLIARNSENVTPVAIACFTMGAQLNTLDPFYAKKDIVHMFSITKPKIIFCDEENFETVQEACKDINIHPIMVIIYGRIAGYPSVEDFFTPNGKEEIYIPPALINGTKQTAIIICSSGTTGPPKGVCLSHAALLHNCVLPFHSDDVILNFNSLYWLTGVIFLITGTLISCTRVITTKPLNPELMLNIIKKYRITCVLSAPFHLSTFIHSEMLKSSDLSSLKFYICSGSPVHKSLIEKFYEKLPRNSPCRLKGGYGMSECAGFISLDMSNNDNLITDSVGKIIKNTVLKIIDSNGRLCSIGDQGEICIKSKYNFLGYFGNEEATKRTVDDDGWIYTGDNGYFDADGHLFLTGRKKDIFKYNLYHITPLKIEAVINQHPDVQSVCVVGVEDTATDLPAAVVIRKNGATVQEDDIKKLVEDNMPDYNRLRGGVYFVHRMPLTPSGKVLRRNVQEYANNLYHKAKLTLKFEI